MKIWRVFAVALPVTAAAIVGGSAPAIAESEYICVTSAYRINGSFVRGTRAEVSRFDEDRACRIAIRRCRRQLDEARYSTRRPMPLARCRVVDVFSITAGAEPRPRDAARYDDDWERRDDPYLEDHDDDRRDEGYRDEAREYEEGPAQDDYGPDAYPAEPDSGYGEETYGACNYVACDERYRSFRARDCSFQPYEGPRRRCTL